jgi:ATP-dependent phosphoenolpyruvate carboxykinase
LTENFQQICHLGFEKTTKPAIFALANYQLPPNPQVLIEARVGWLSGEFAIFFALS